MVLLLYPAHIRTESDGGQTIQSVGEHSLRTADLAEAALSSIELGKAGRLAGLLHDIGKLTEVFRKYILYSSGRRGSVIHTFQGCRLLLDAYHRDGAPRLEDITCELLAYAVAAHHGLFDCVDQNRRQGFLYRRTHENTSYDEAYTQALSLTGGVEALDELFRAAHESLAPIYEKLLELANGDRDPEGEELSFYIGLLARLLTSSVMDGDRSDTAAFMSGTTLHRTRQDMRSLWSDRLSFMESALAALSSDTPINRARQAISDRCRNNAALPPGVFRLNVPTGSGKTLASLRFALAHAAQWNKQRIIFTAPLLTIIDQNAAVIKEYVGCDELILEHHSDLIREDASSEELDQKAMLMENWSAPIIITTMVQLLDTLFAGRSPSVRRFQALCDSVIVIDEVQTVPSRMLSLFNLAINFLTSVCGASVVLCSATQPSLEAAVHPLASTPIELVPYDDLLWAPFRRTRIVPVTARPLAEIPLFINEVLKQANSVLVVCNKKAQAAALFKTMRGADTVCFHLSASMCMAHRKTVLQLLSQALAKSREGGDKVICIATQVIEAGVDISFECVVRLAAGMDSVVQSAGRCNRNHEAETEAPVYLLPCADEQLSFLRVIRDARTATLDLLTLYRTDAARFGDDLSSDEAIRYYYRSLYRNMPHGYQDYTVEGHTLFDLLSLNRQYADEDCVGCDHYYMRQAFKLAGSLFRVFDDESIDAVVPYAESREYISSLLNGGEYLSDEALAAWLRQAKPFTISLFRYQLEQLERAGGIVQHAGIYLLSESCYDKDLGLMINNHLELLEV